MTSHASMNRIYRLVFNAGSRGFSGGLMHPAHVAATAVLAFGFLSNTSAQSMPPKWGAHVDFEAKPGSKRSLAESDFFLPIKQTERTLFFGNLRGRFDNQNSREGNLGLGVRHMQEGGWNIGGYGYLDRRKTGNGNFFNQATLGGEALGRDWDFRANAYLPYGQRVRDAGTASTASLSGTTVLVSSVTTQERALRGFDAEVGWRVPLFDVESPRQLRLYIGGYRFSDVTTRLSGPRLRAEFTVADLPQLWRGAQLVVNAEVQDDNIRGRQTFVALRLRVPLGGEKERPRLNWQEQRMTTPVLRDVDIVAPLVARAPVIETATATANGQPLTILSSSTTTGAALPAAVAAAGANSTVVLTGTYATTATVALQPGQTLAGTSPIVVRTPSGATATLTGPGAVINGSFNTTTGVVRLDSNSTLSGMTVNSDGGGGSSSIAVRAFGNGARILNNTITASVPGSGAGASVSGILIFSGPTNVVVSNNTIGVTSTNAGNIKGINASLGGFGTVTLSGNTITLTGTGNIKQGIEVAGGVPGGTIATITGNTISVTGAGGPNQAVLVVNSAITAGSSGNVRVAGSCAFSAGTSGSIGFADGTSCP
ncbi:inverse autotransporter beta domain-containing protein [Polaromonas sp. A23]|uniref:inverse autotransporter beta domain-containing protein n=1 Tax=Polaromonas sp. A23 TaxID=1944133 RepID=UPI000986D2DF|nr:inverse autotransporter beta domain-containing protein [Polaromonas sp. A23]